MATRKIRYFVEKKNARGGVRHYWQPAKALEDAGWRTRRLPDDAGAAIGEAERLNRNLDAWRTAHGANAVRGAGGMAGGKPATVAALIAAFKASRFYRDDIAPKTRRWYDQNLKLLEDLAGASPVLAIDRALVEDIYTSMRTRTPARAAALVRAGRRLYNFARIPYGAGLANPFEKPGIKAGRRQPARVWSFAEHDHMIACADAMGWPSVGDAIAAAWWLGQRQGDILDLARADYRDGTFHVTQHKTGARIAVPHSPALAARIEAAIARQRTGGVEGTHLILHENTHQRWQEDTFRHVFAEIRAKATETMPGCAELLFRHLRHTAVTNLHSSGCDAGDIATISGHSLAGVEQILDVYFVRTAETAARAAKKRLAWEARERAKAGKNGE